MMKFWLGVLTAAFCAVSAAAESTDMFPFVKEARLSAGAAGKPFYVIPLDADIYRHTMSALEHVGNARRTGICEVKNPFGENGFPDIRVTDGTGAMVPFTVVDLRNYRENTELEPLAGNIVSFARPEGANRGVITYELAGDEPLTVSRISFDVGSGDFNKHLKVEDENGKVLVNAPFFRHARNLDLASTSFDFEPTPLKRIRISIYNFEEKRDGEVEIERKGVLDSFTERSIITERFKINGITLYTPKKRMVAGEIRRSVRFKPGIVRRQDNGGDTVIEFDTANIPFSSLAIKTSTPNYQRKVALHFMHGAAEDSYAEYGTITSAAKHEFEFHPESTRGTGAKLIIANGDDAPLENLEFEWSSPEKVILIDAASVKGDTLNVWYGGNSDRMPDYDIRNYASKFGGMPGGEFALGEERPNPQYAANGTAGAASRLKTAVTVVVALAALVLAVLVVRMFRKLNADA